MTVADADQPRLEANPPGGKPTVFPLGKRTVLGRHPQADLRLLDREVSKFHCRLEIVDDFLVVRDQGSSNGTFVNGRRIHEHSLSEGDVLVVGNSRFTVRLGKLKSAAKPLEQQMLDGAMRDHVFIYPFARLNELLDEGERRIKALDDKERLVETQLNAAMGVGELATLRTNLEKLRIASDFHQGLGLEPDGAAVPTMLVRVARQLTDADNVVLFMVDGRDRLVRRASSRRHEEQDELPISNQVLERVRTERATVLSGNIRGDARFPQPESVVAFGIRSVLAVPLLKGGAVCGILHCDTRQRPDAFTDSDARILAGLAAHAALAISPAKSF
jgi:pSer/pThr/pTyr-binding forkhead associated (FHA) protein